MFHQFDGYAVPTSNADYVTYYWTMVSGKQKKTRKEKCEYFLKQLFPEWFRVDFSIRDSYETAQEAVERLESLIFGVEKTYVNDWRCLTKSELDTFVSKIKRSFFWIHCRLYKTSKSF